MHTNLVTLPSTASVNLDRNSSVTLPPFPHLLRRRSSTSSLSLHRPSSTSSFSYRNPNTNPNSTQAFQWFTRAAAKGVVVGGQLWQPYGLLRMTTSYNSRSSNCDDIDAIFKQKRAIRNQVKKTLKAMDPSLRSQQDDIIQDIILGAPWFKSSLGLCAYISCSALQEVDTFKLLSQILQPPPTGGKKLYVPRVEDKNSHMRMLNISRIDDLIANSMNILEPAPVDSDGNAREDVLQANDPVDILLLPGLAFDRSGRRLGRGGGYYDTFLKNYQDLAEKRNWKQPLLVALSYSEQILDDGVIPVTSTDVPVDALVSPEGVIPITSAALNRMNL